MKKSSTFNLLFLVSLYALIAAGYFVLRYAGQWADSDTANLTEAAIELISLGELKSGNSAYPAGYAYQSFVAFLSLFSGLSIQQLQLLVLPFIAAGLSMLAFVMYRELTGSAPTAALAAILLFMQPDFLFVIFRGSHEKVTWLAVILAVWLLARSFTPGQRLSRFAAQAGLFYIFVLLLVGSNAYMGSSFIIAVEISLAAGFLVVILLRRKSADPSALTIPRLVYVIGLAMVIWFLIIFYIYPPASDLLRTLQTVSGRSIAIGLGQETGINPYASLQRGWVSQFAYLGVALPTFLLGFTSFLVWFQMGLQLLRRRAPFDRPQAFLLWLIYAGFGIQLALSIVLDQLGSVSGNFQLRIFPPLLLFAAPLLAQAISRAWQNRAGSPSRRWLAVASTLFLVWASLASLLKATNDPALSNYWIFWTKPENTALAWTDQYFRNDQLWMDQMGIRLSSHASSLKFGQASGNLNYAGPNQAIINSFLISDMVQSLSTRLPGITLPDAQTANRVYDNGSTRIYRERPKTPYQR